MDITALGFGFGINPSSEGQTPVLPGFDLFLAEQPQLTPPLMGAPPGPEPPPDFSAMEEVEGTEPNAQPQKLDFQSLPKIEVELDLPKPFWELPTKTVADAELTKVPIEQAMQWLAAQTTSGFFESPMFTPTPETAPVKVDTVARLPRTISEDQVDAIPLELGIPKLPELRIRLNQPIADTPVLIEDHVAEELNLQSAKKLAPVQIRFTTPLPKPAEIGVVSVVNPTQPKLEDSNEVLAVSQPVTDAPKVDLSPVQPPKFADAAEVKPIVAKPKPEASAAQTLKETLEPAVATWPEAKPVQAPVRDQRGQDDYTKRGNSASKASTPVPEIHFDVPANEEIEKVSTKPEFKTDRAVIQVENCVEISTVEKPKVLAPREVDLVVKQVADRLHMLAAARPKNGVEIHLHPEDLGSITVVVKSIGRIVEAELKASDDRVRQALETNHGRLVEAMDSRGFHLQAVAVSSQNSGGNTSDSQRFAGQHGQSQSRSSNDSQGHPDHADSHFGQPKSNLRAWVRRGEGVDLAI